MTNDDFLKPIFGADAAFVPSIDIIKSQFKKLMFIGLSVNPPKKNGERNLQMPIHVKKPR